MRSALNSIESMTHAWIGTDFKTTATRVDGQNPRAPLVRPILLDVH